jgi:hypothetical protein
MTEAKVSSKSLAAGAQPIPLPPNCPPQTAKPHTGAVYRLVNSSPTTYDDFKTYFVLYPGRKWTKKELCPAHGLSVRLSAEAAAWELSRFRARIKGGTWHVAMAILSSSDGPVDQTFSADTHYTWWPRHGFDFASMFSVQQLGQ